MHSVFRRRIIWISFLFTIIFAVSNIMSAGAATLYKHGNMAGGDTDWVPGEIIVKYRSGGEAQVRSRVSFSGAQKTASLKGAGVELYSLPKDQDVQKVLQQLNSDPDVIFAEPNRYRKVMATASSAGGVPVSNDTHSDKQWNLDAVGAPVAWGTPGLAGSIIAAVVDTGVDNSHVDLATRTVPGINLAGTKADGTAYDPNDAMDDYGHGTSVAGVLAAATNNGLGVAGVAGTAGVSVMPVKVLNNEGWGTSYNVSQGIKYAADHGARVINLSLGGDYSRVEAEAVTYAQQKNCLVVASVGNGAINADNVMFPAALPGVMTVASTDKLNKVSWFSNYGDCVDIAAPGEDIWSTSQTSVSGAVYESGYYYAPFKGTSLAAPHVSAAAAMYMLKNPAASAKNTFDALTGTAVDDTIKPGKDQSYGYGLLNIGLALGSAQTPQGGVHFIRPEAGSTVFGDVVLAVQVDRPAEVDHLELYFRKGSENILIGGRLNQNPSDPKSLFELVWNSASKDGSGIPLYPDGDQKIIASAFNSAGSKLCADAELPVKIKNNVDTGLSFQVLDPSGQPASNAWMIVLVKEQIEGGYYYETVATLPSDADGRVRIPGTIARDLNDFVVLVSGVFKLIEGGIETDTAFLYQRSLEGPKGVVIDGSNATPTVLTGLDKSGSALRNPKFRAAPLDKNGYPYMFAQLSTDKPSSTIKAFLDKGIYDLYALSFATEGTYFLLRNDYSVTNLTSTVSFAGNTAGSFKTSLPAGLKKMYFYAMDNRAYQYGYSYGFEAGAAIYLLPGSYRYMADIFMQETSGTNWRYLLDKPDPLSLAAGEEKAVTFGGNFTTALSYPASEGDVAYKDRYLVVENRVADTDGHRLNNVRKGVSLPQSAEVLKLSLPDNTAKYSITDSRGAWQSAEVSNSPEPVDPYFALINSGGTVAASTFGNFGSKYQLPITTVPAGPYTGRVSASIGPIASAALLANRALTVAEGSGTPEPISTIIYGRDNQPAQNANLTLYRWWESYGGFINVGVPAYTSNSSGLIKIPAANLSDSQVHLALVTYSTTDGKVIMARAFRGSGLPAEFRMAGTRPVTIEELDRGGNKVTPTKPAVMFMPIHDGTTFSGLKIDDCGSKLFVEPGNYHFIDRFTKNAGSAQQESYYLIAANVPVGESGAVVTLDGKATAKIIMTVSGEGYLGDGWQGPLLFLPFNQYDYFNVDYFPFGTIYVTGGNNIEYYPTADILRRDKERTQDLWNYILAWVGENGYSKKFTAGEEVAKSVGGEYTSSLNMTKGYYTKSEPINGSVVFSDAYQNRLVDLLICNDYNSVTAALAAQSGPNRLSFSRLPDGKISVSLVRQGEVSTETSEIRRVDPFLYINRVTAAGEEKFIKSGLDLGLKDFSVPAGTLAANGSYRAEAALGAGPAGPVHNPPDQGRFNLASYYLTGLVLKSGDMTVPLNKTFSATDTSYTAQVANSAASVTVTPAATSAGAIIKVNNAAAASGQASQAISLSEGSNGITVVVIAEDGSTLMTYTVTVTKAAKTVINQGSPTVAVTNEPVDITVHAGVTGASIAVTPTTEGSNKVFTMPLVEVTASTDLGNVTVQIPTGTKITGPSDWNGNILLPILMENTNAEVAVEIGFGDKELAFDKAVRLIFPGQAGKRVGFSRGGSPLTEITYVLSADTQAAADAELSGAIREGKFDRYSPNEMAVWTRHFTTFVFYPQTTSGGVGGGGGGGGSVAEGTTVTVNGGTVTDKGAVITIPAGAISSDIRVKVARVNDTSILPAAGSQLVSDILEITKDKAGSFTKTVSVTMAFDKSRVSADKHIISIYWLDESTKKWVELQNVKSDLTAGSVSGEINHFAKFAVIATEKAAPAILLRDIVSHWALGSINKLMVMGAIKGYSDSTFRPDNNITRAEFATVLVKAFKLAPQSGKTFADTTGHWAGKDIATASHYGIINGYDEASFGPDDLITREQMAVMIVKAAKLSNSAEGVPFKDSGDISHWASRSVETAAIQGIIKGYPDKTFKPKGNATRAEAVTVIVNAMK